MSVDVITDPDRLPNPLPVGSVLTRHDADAGSWWRVWEHRRGLPEDGVGTGSGLRYRLVEDKEALDEAEAVTLTHSDLREEIAEGFTAVETVAVTADEVREAVEAVTPVECRDNYDGALYVIDDEAATVNAPGEASGAESPVVTVDAVEEPGVRGRFRDRLAERLTGPTRTVEVSDYGPHGQGTLVEVQVVEQIEQPAGQKAAAEEGGA